MCTGICIQGLTMNISHLNMMACGLWRTLTACWVLLLLALLQCGCYAGRVDLGLADPYVYEMGRRCDVQDGCLQLSSATGLEGEDNLGQYYEDISIYQTPSGFQVIFSARLYGDGIQVFKQQFPDGLFGTSTGDKDLVSTAYPRLTLPDPTTSPDLRYMTPGGYMAGWTLYSHGSMSDELNWFRDGEDGGIVALFQPGEDGLGTDSVVLSPLTQPMATNVRLDKENYTLEFGVQGQAEDIVPGYTSEVLLVSGNSGITKNIMGWGTAIRNYYNTFKLVDQSAMYLSYYTDNGAAHYYNPLPFHDFREALINVYNYSVDNDIPIRRLQLDSWWYHKGAGNGVKNWTAIESRIPGGIEGLNQDTGWPIVAHNRYFSSDTDYAMQNGGPYPFTVDEEQEKSLPLDRAFWNDLLDDALLWGLETYEQDWLDRQYMFTSALHTNLTLGATWLNDMGNAALVRGVNIQYCMALTRHLLHSITVPAVTQIRVSDDYILNPTQWRIGVTSLLAHVLDLMPYKDVFWTSSVNEDVIFLDCELVLPDLEHPWKFTHQYGGRANTSASGKPCVPWREFGWDELYFGSGMYENLCRNPETIRDGAFCYTKASFDIPEEEWEWEYCDVPRCDLDCYVYHGNLYIGNHNITQSGQQCVDWNGEHNITGAKCRNPTNDIAPWCYVTEDHLEWDYCNNKCEEAVEMNPYLQSAVSTLAGGPLGIGDKPWNFDKELIMKSCNSDGLLLHPTKPLTVIDGYFWSNDYRELWTGYSKIGEYDFGIIFLAEIDMAHNLSPADLNLENAFTTSTLVVSLYPSGLSYQVMVAPDETVPLPSCGGTLNFCLLYTSPVFPTTDGDLYIVGEVDKWVPVSPERMLDITASESTVTLTVAGIAGETVTMSFSGSTWFSVTCDFVTSGTMIIDTSARTCL